MVKLITFNFILVVIFSDCAIANNACEGKMNPHTEKMAREYMAANNLIKEGEEIDLEDIITNKWSLYKVVPVKNHCFLIMDICSFLNDGTKSCDGFAYEVLGLKNSQIVPFEELYSVPNQITAKIGLSPKIEKEKNLSYYFVTLSGIDAINATKSFITSTPYGGFSGIAIRGSKAAFDPTANRDWHIADAHFDLRRGSTAEVLDIQAFQFDGLDSAGAEAYWSGCWLYQEKKYHCQIAPWGQTFIHEILPLQ